MFFTWRVVMLWYRLPTGAVSVPSLEVLRARIEGALGSPAHSKGLELDNL